MITNSEISSNTERFINLLRSTGRENIEDLISYLLDSDFFEAPASTKYHGAYRGGLCEHCLKVYNRLSKLIYTFSADIDPDTAIIAALLHDLAKINQYEKTVFNKKVYSPSGSKTDELGSFDWVSSPGYVTAPEENRIVYGNHEETSEFIARQFITLTIEESAAIAHHHGSMGWDSIPAEAIGPIYNRYPLAVYLHMADFMSAYIDKT